MNRLLFIRFYACLTVIISVIIIGFTQDVFVIANLHFYLLAMLVFMEVISERSISLMSIWLLGFFYIILSDILLRCYDSANSWAAKFMLLSNDVVIIGYYLTKSTKKKPTTIIKGLNKPSR